jgi:hypothetical protein
MKSALLPMFALLGLGSAYSMDPGSIANLQVSATLTSGDFGPNVISPSGTKSSVTKEVVRISNREILERMDADPLLVPIVGIAGWKLVVIDGDYYAVKGTQQVSVPSAILDEMGYFGGEPISGFEFDPTSNTLGFFDNFVDAGLVDQTILFDDVCRGHGTFGYKDVIFKDGTPTGVKIQLESTSLSFSGDVDNDVCVGTLKISGAKAVDLDVLFP